LSACSNDLRVYNQEEIFCADIVAEEGGKINLKKLKEILETHENIGVIRSGSHGELSVLHEACSSGQTDAVKLLLAHKEKLNLNAGNFSGACVSIPLGYAVLKGHYDIAELLLKNGADPNGLVGTDTVYVRSALAETIYTANKKMFALLKKYGADINAKDKDGCTEFLRCDSSENLEKLIRAGADIHATDSSGYSKFFLLPSINNVGSDEIEKIVKILKKSGSDINEVHSGQTPLSKLIAENEFETAKILFNNGARFPQKYIIYRYTMQPVNLDEISNTELAGKTFAEVETKRYKEEYERKMHELKCVFELFVDLYRSVFKDNKIAQDRIKTMQKQEQDFENFIKAYAEKNTSLYLRSAWYNYYGALIDMINLRIKHLKMHLEQLD
jgi:ankyrin repeat protein